MLPHEAQIIIQRARDLAKRMRRYGTMLLGFVLSPHLKYCALVCWGFQLLPLQGQGLHRILINDEPQLSEARVEVNGKWSR